MSAQFRQWAPRRELRHLLESAESEARRDLLLRLGTDERMRSFWAWLDRANDEAEAANDGHELDPITLIHSVYRGTRPPQKPGNLSPAKRQKYLDDVQVAAKRLRLLLEGTRFDLPAPDDLARQLTDYPICKLTDQLSNLIEWTEQDDQHDRGNRPAWMIKQTGTAAQKNYLVAELTFEFDRLRRWPEWADLASLVNVVLDLDETDELSVDAIRRTVERQRKENKSSRPGREGNFADAIADYLTDTK